MKRQLPALLLCLTLLLSACGGLSAGAAAPIPAPAEPPVPAPTAFEAPPIPEEPPPPEPTAATLAVCGDAMSHMPITDDAWNGERYDYARIMAAAKPYV
ncbi:MAG: CapA family protein, partial [Oscillibacter sp.]|nr:CapA family protein [Oscillibacter sp.]